MEFKIFEWGTRSTNIERLVCLPSVPQYFLEKMTLKMRIKGPQVVPKERSRVIDTNFDSGSRNERGS